MLNVVDVIPGWIPELIMLNVDNAVPEPWEEH